MKATARPGTCTERLRHASGFALPRAHVFACIALIAAFFLGAVRALAQPLPDFIPLWDFDHPDSTEQRFRALLPAAEASHDVDYLAQLMTQIARTEGLQRRFDDAHRTLDRVEPMLRADLSKARVRYLLERGRTFNSSGNTEEAKTLFLAAWDLAREGKVEGLAVDAAHMMAIAEEPIAAIEWNNRAIAYAEKASDPKARDWLGSLYNNQGWAYHDMGDYAKAIDLFERAQAWREAKQSLPEIRIAKWCVARCLRSLGRVDEALARQQALLTEFGAAGEEDGYCQEELGECLLLLHREAEARPHFERAYALLSKDPWLVADEAPRLERLRRLGAGEGESKGQ